MSMQINRIFTLQPTGITLSQLCKLIPLPKKNQSRNSLSEEPAENRICTWFKTKPAYNQPTPGLTNN